MPSPLFSIVILVRSSHHLLPLCLDTIRFQSERGFEVLLIGKGPLGLLHEMAEAYADLPIRISSSEGDLISDMMNTGIRASSGRYVQFLCPEDRFLSKQALACLTELIQEGSNPDLIYSGCSLSDWKGLPEMLSFSLDRSLLQQGIFPMAFRSSCFSKNTLLELGGFDRDFSYRGPFDAMCRLFQKETLNVICSRRVLTDCEMVHPAPGEIVRYAMETCRILYRYFGPWSAVRWLFGKHHLPLFRWAAHAARQAFWKDPVN